MSVLAMPKKMLRRAKQMLPKAQENLVVQPLWIDKPDAAKKIAALKCDDDIKACLTSISENGYGVLKAALTPQKCDALIAEFKDYCAPRDDSKTYKDKHGLHERLASFHLVSKEAKALYEHQKVQELLTIMFEEKPKMIGSLFFEKSTEQDFHRDTPTFFTNPINRYFGVWFALEDIATARGPLRYYPGSHKIKDDAILRTEYSNSEDYQAALLKMCDDAGLTPEEFHPQKGDVLIWHPQLFHGGCPRDDQSLTRYSMVYHWMASSASIHPPSDFFSGATRFDKKSTTFKTLGDVKSIDHGKPRFFHNRKEGNFDEFD